MSGLLTSAACRWALPALGTADVDGRTPPAPGTRQSEGMLGVKCRPCGLKLLSSELTLSIGMTWPQFPQLRY